MSATLAERLAPVQDTLAELEREWRTQANAGNAPDTWAAWADLQAALQAVRAAQGRDARARRYAPPVGPAAFCGPGRPGPLATPAPRRERHKTKGAKT